MKKVGRGMQMSWRMFVGACALFLAACCPGLVDRAQAAFHEASPAELAGAPGTLIRQEPVIGAPQGAAGYRLLYRSTGLHGEPIAVSAIMIVPGGPVPEGGRPVVAWAHPTSGVATRCAPSLFSLKFAGVQGLEAMLKRGFVVVATDYPGLGTSGTHPYLVGTSEARAVLDSVRAARRLPEAEAGDRFVAWGHSQGGQAVLFAGIEAHGYAPELKLLGVAAAAPATDLATLLADDFATAGGKDLTAMTLWSWARVFGAPIDKVVEPAAMPAVDRIAGECLESIFDVLEHDHSEKPLNKAFLSVDDVTRVEPWRSLMARNSPGVLPRAIPVFLAQGTADTTVRPAVTASYFNRLCKAGSPVRMVVMHGVSHDFIGRDSASEAVAWMADRFAGKPAPSDCGKI